MYDGGLRPWDGPGPRTRWGSPGTVALAPSVLWAGVLELQGSAASSWVQRPSPSSGLAPQGTPKRAGLSARLDNTSFGGDSGLGRGLPHTGSPVEPP